MKDLANLDAIALAQLVRDKQVSPLELVDDVVQRIEALNPQLNAVITPMFDAARDAAKGALPEGPFKGVPYLLKDIVAAYRGVRMTSGSASLEDFKPRHDTEIVARLRRAGFLVVGKTNTPEFGFLPTTEPRRFGPTRNPWALERTAGGSSGGAAAAVAARMVPAAHANDGGGSIRIPASCCGVFGLKPTRGRISLGPDLGDVMSGLLVEHCITRSVRDSAAILDATAGPTPGDPYFAPPPSGPFLSEVGLAPGKLRIAVTIDNVAGVPVHKDCKRAAHNAARLCEALGHEIVEQDPPISGEMFAQAFMALWTAGAAASIDGAGLLRGRPVSRHEVEPLSWALAEIGRGLTAPDYLLAVSALHRIARKLAALLEDVDLWLTPTLALPPVPLGTFDADEQTALTALQRSTAFSPYTPLANVSGHPSMSVPLSWNDDGIPIGVQFTARYGDEATLFRLASQLEQAQPWDARRPSVCA